MEIRSFLAFELPREIKDVVSRAYEGMKKKPLDVRWVKLENVHLTIVFMGSISSEDLEPIADAVAGVCRAFGPFDIFLHGTGVFSSRRHPKVLWVGLSGDVERMSEFRDGLQTGLMPFGIKQERRRFRPHLTLGRFRKGSKSGIRLERLLSKYQDLTSAACPVDELIMFRSDLKPNGAVYSVLKRWPLTGKR